LSCRAPGPKLDPLIETWPAGQAIHVIHDAAFEPDSFNPGVDAAGTLRNATRFAPIRDAKSRVVPYLYGGSSRDCAIFETVFHNVPIDAPDKFVDLDDFANRAHGRVVPTRDLQLVNLTTDGLHRLKVPKAELITSPPIDYLATARWAEAIHHRFPGVDGLVWMSRQRDRDQALMLFGDRAGASLTGARMGTALRGNDVLRQAILTLALRVGIDVS
jgi:RES domain